MTRRLTRQQVNSLTGLTGWLSGNWKLISVWVNWIVVRIKPAVIGNRFWLGLNWVLIDFILVQLKLNPVKENRRFNSISIWSRVDRLGSELTGLTLWPAGWLFDQISDYPFLTVRRAFWLDFSPLISDLESVWGFGVHSCYFSTLLRWGSTP